MTAPAEAGALVARGEPLREGLDAIVAAGGGALVVVGDEAAVDGLADGGFRLDAPFTSQGLYELSKMDGAVLLDASCTRFLRANAHLVPDRGTASGESGIRHRVAEQVSRSTDAVVIAVSEHRRTITVYRDGARATIEG